MSFCLNIEGMLTSRRNWCLTMLYAMYRFDFFAVRLTPLSKRHSRGTLVVGAGIQSVSWECALSVVVGDGSCTSVPSVVAIPSVYVMSVPLLVVRGTVQGAV
jgi:hypothetical protein